MYISGTRDWQNAAIGPKQGNLLCFECRSYNKKYGELPPQLTPQSPAECPSPATSDVTVAAESPSRMRTRNKSKETVLKLYMYNYYTLIYIIYHWKIEIV